MKRVKKYIAYIVAAVFAPIVGGCNFLEVDPIGKTTIPLFFSDIDGIRAAVPGAYSSVFNYYNSEFYRYPDVAGNMIALNSVGGGTEMLNQFNFTSNPDHEVEAVGSIWTKIWEAMANVNNIIEYQPQLREIYPANREELDRIKAEALFLRALCHFDLVRVYGQPFNYTPDASHLGIPVLLKTPGANDNLPRVSVKEVYERVEGDLKESLSLYGSTTGRDAYHASYQASVALLSRMYLYMEKWDSVVKYSSISINAIPLSTKDDYIKMFNEMEPGNEAIFRLNGLNKNTSLGKFYNILNPTYIPADTLISLFDNQNDIRLPLLKIGDSRPLCLKYYISKGVPDIDKHYDPMVLRVSEQYLNRAEAYLNLGNLEGAANDLKMIIGRAIDENYTEVVLNYSSSEELAQLIQKERAKELCFEGHNFFDITRRKENLVRELSTNSSVKLLTYPNYLFVLPIPQKEIDANPNMQQNPTSN